jgi:hypothetical protein
MAAAALVNTKRAKDTLATVKAIFNNFMLEVHGKMESEFDKQTIWKMASSIAKSIMTSEHGFNKGALDILLPSARDSELLEIESDKFRRHDHLSLPPPRLGITNSGHLESSSTLSSSDGDDHFEKSIHFN